MCTDLSMRIGSGVICNSSDCLNRKVFHLPGTSGSRRIILVELSELVEVVNMCRCVDGAHAQGPHVVHLAVDTKCACQSKAGIIVESIPCDHRDIAYNIAQIHEWSNQIESFLLRTGVNSIQDDNRLDEID